MEKKLKRLTRAITVLCSLLLILLISIIITSKTFYVTKEIFKLYFGYHALLMVIIAVIAYTLLSKRIKLKYEILKRDIKEKLSKKDFTEVLFKPVYNSDNANFMYKILNNIGDITYLAKVQENDKIEIVVLGNNDTKMIMQNYEISDYEYFDTNFEIKE